MARAGGPGGRIAARVGEVGLDAPPAGPLLTAALLEPLAAVASACHLGALGTMWRGMAAVGMAVGVLVGDSAVSGDGVVAARAPRPLRAGVWRGPRRGWARGQGAAAVMRVRVAPSVHVVGVGSPVSVTCGGSGCGTGGSSSRRRVWDGKLPRVSRYMRGSAWSPSTLCNYGISPNRLDALWVAIPISLPLKALTKGGRNASP